jgi:phasin family protein
MFPIQNQISDVARTSFESQIAAMVAMTGSTMESMEKLMDLNLNAIRASLEESIAISRQFLEVKDPQGLFVLIAAQAKPNVEKALAYSRHVINIASSAQEGFNKATEAQLQETNRKVSRLMEDAAKNAPAGSESVVAIVKSAIGNASAGYEQLHKTTKQATEALEATVTAAVNQLAQAPDPIAAAAPAAPSGS